MPGYYYNAARKTYHTSITEAVYTDLNARPINENVGRYGAAEWSQLMRPDWCKAHPDEACEIMGFTKTKTKFKLELSLRAWIYELLTTPKHRAD